MNLIVGATGMLGGEICRLLAEQGKPIRALVRKTSSPDKLAHLRSLGAEVVLGDLKDRASLEVACRGASAVVSTASSTLTRQQGDSIESVDRQGQLNLIEAAEKAGGGHNKISWISFQDVAKFAVAALENPRATNAVIKLGGPDALSPLEVVRLAEQAAGKKVVVQHVPEEALRAQHATSTDALQQSFAGLMLYYAGGDVIDMTETLQAFPVEHLKSVREHLQATA